MALSIGLRESGLVTILDLRGKLAGDAGDDLRERLDELVTQGQRQLVLNLADVSFVDSAALGGLLAQRSAVQAEGGHLKLLNVGARISDLLVTTKLEMVFDTYESESAAVDSFAVNTPPTKS